MPDARQTPCSDQTVSPARRGGIFLSVVAPAHNEQENVERLVNEVDQTLASTGIAFEMIVVDDGSTDETQRRLRDLQSTRPWLRVLAMQNTPPGKGLGQSAAFQAGFRAARGDLIAVLDADLQNDPADLPFMLEVLDKTGADMVQGDRSANRRDHIGRRVGSWIGRMFRWYLLGDSIRDTGCSLRVMRADIARQVPLQYRGMHRFIPITARQLGYKVVEAPVHHRPRVAGQAKYGTFNRAIPSLIDCLAVRWMWKRRRPTEAVEIKADDAG